MRRFLLKTLAALVALVVLIGVLAYVYVRQSLPTVDGTVTVSGLSAPIDIIRDADAIPHIFASTKHDALYGLGYVHAQDRLWQMEFQRRIGHGRLSEILGPATLPQDRFLRTVGFGRAARSAWSALPDVTRQQVNAYVSGINAFVATHHGSALPPEFTVLRFEPEPWEGADVIVWVKMMAWDLSANYIFELLRHDLVARVGADRMAQLMPPYPHEGLSILGASLPAYAYPAPPAPPAPPALPAFAHPSTDQASAGKPAPPAPPALPAFPAISADSWASAFARGLAEGDAAVRDSLLGGATAEALGSNNWVIDGTMSATGKPLLANDPHLGTRLPSTWYLAHMSAGEFDVIGATMPGCPGIALGRNRFIAWGMTNVAADVEDLYRERIDATGKLAEFAGAQEPLQIVTETIRIKGEKPVQLAVRISRHGPLVSDALNANNAALRREPRPAPLEPLAFRWTALDPDDTTIASVLRVNEARNWDEFTAALRDFVVPSQNVVYADVNGHIGYYAPGRIPIRAHGDGSQPADGWTGQSEWTGWIPFERLPHLYDPPEHFIITANHRPAPPDYPYVLGLEWPQPYRAQRVTDLILGAPNDAFAGRTGGTGRMGRSRLARDTSRQTEPEGAALSSDTKDGRGPRTGGKLTVDDFAAIQADTLSLHAKAMLPALLPRVQVTSTPERVALGFGPARIQQAVDMLRQWNHNATGDSAAAAIFEAWFLRLAPAIAGDEVGPLVSDRYQERFTYITRFVLNALASGVHDLNHEAEPPPSSDGGPQKPLENGRRAPRMADWCDNVGTPARETCDDAVTTALDEALVQLTERLGQDMSRWRWDAVHRAVFPHQGLDSVAALRPLLSRSVASAGDWSTVNVGPVAADRPFEQRQVPGYREIIDLSPANDSRFLDAVGQSGHPLSRHYDDFLGDWQAVKHRKMRMDRTEIERGAIGRLRLTPHLEPIS